VLTWKTVIRRACSSALRIPSAFAPDTFLVPSGPADAEETEFQIAAMKSQGVHAAMPLSGGGDLKPPYLSEAWFQVIKDMLDTAERHNFKIWPLDEAGAPSGSAEMRLAEINASRERQLSVSRANSRTLIRCLCRKGLYLACQRSGATELGEMYPRG